MGKFSWKTVNVAVPVPVPGTVRLRQSQAFKLAVALLVGVIAALIIMMIGFGAEYRLSTVLYRSFVGFLFGSVIVFALELLLDRVGIPMFVAKNAEMQSVWVSEAYDDDFLYAIDEETAEPEEKSTEAQGTDSDGSVVEKEPAEDTDSAVDQLLADVAAEDSGEKSEPDFVPFFADKEPEEFNAFTAENLPKAEENPPTEQ